MPSANSPGVSFNETQLRGASFRDCILTEVYAPVLRAARSTLRDVEISNPRWGSAELYEGGWQSVRIDGGKLDYLNLRGSKLTDVLITDCIINELDLGSATATRVALKNCTIGSLDLSGARLKDFDLRGTDFRTISGLGSLAGLVIDDYQLGLWPRSWRRIWGWWWRNQRLRGVRLTVRAGRVIFIERTVGNLSVFRPRSLRKGCSHGRGFSCWRCPHAGRPIRRCALRGPAG